MPLFATGSVSLSCPVPFPQDGDEFEFELTGDVVVESNANGTETVSVEMRIRTIGGEIDHSTSSHPCAPGRTVLPPLKLSNTQTLYRPGRNYVGELKVSLASDNSLLLLKTDICEVAVR